MPDVQEVFRMSTQKVRQDPGAMERQHARQRKAERNRKIGAIAVVAALVGLGGWFVAQLGPASQVADPIPPHGLGIFEPFAGKIIYQEDCLLWTCSLETFEGSDVRSIDPTATDPTPAALASGIIGTPVGWSSDGTELLVTRVQGHDGSLVVLHADGTETSLLGPLKPAERHLLSAAISPDGSRVAYTAPTEDGGSGLYAIDVDSGRTSLLVEPNMGSILNYEGDAYQPTFSPDGTQIAFIQGGGDHSHSVWVVDVDGTDPHMIVRNDVTWGWNGGHVFGLAWSPTGDRIALGLRGSPVASIYTFTPNGSRFTRLIRDALAPSWSPDGSQIAYYPCPEDRGCRDGNNEDLSGGGLGVADADGSHPQTFGVGGSGPWNPA